jgi:hypothetical protein
MAEIQVPDFERLYAKLNNTKLQSTNPSLWELLKELIRLLVQFARAITGAVNGNSDLLGGFANRTFLTEANESPYFPFSRQLLAGSGVTFDDSVTNQRTINTSSLHYDCPLSDGDPIAADLIFADGECIIVQVPVAL